MVRCFYLFSIYTDDFSNSFKKSSLFLPVPVLEVSDDSSKQEDQGGEDFNLDTRIQEFHNYFLLSTQAV